MSRKFDGINEKRQEIWKKGKEERQFYLHLPLTERYRSTYLCLGDGLLHCVRQRHFVSHHPLQSWDCNFSVLPWLRPGELCCSTPALQNPVYHLRPIVGNSFLLWEFSINVHTPNNRISLKFFFQVSQHRHPPLLKSEREVTKSQDKKCWSLDHSVTRRSRLEPLFLALTRLWTILWSTLWLIYNSTLPVQYDCTVYLIWSYSVLTGEWCPV